VPIPQPVPTPTPPRPKSCTDSDDLTELSLPPIYSSSDTHIKIDQQAPVLEWLIGQIIKRDPAADINLVGHSLGGVVASYWGGSQIGSESPYRPNIRSIILINSPVGGFPFANALQDCGSDPFCNIFKPIFNFFFGADILRQLQLALPFENNGSITNTLSEASKNFPVTSIQSTADYFVNDISLPTAANVLCQGIDQLVIGIGSQFWRNDKLLAQQQLGGKGLAQQKLCFQDIKGLLDSNHNAAVRERNGAQSAAQRTARLVYESITIPKIPTMSLISLPEFPTLKPGQKTDVEIVVQNTSDFAWPAEGRMKLVNIEGDTFGAATLEALQPIPSGAQVKWILSVTAPAQPGAYHGFWQLTLDHYPFGERIPIVMAVVPQSSNAGFVDMIKTMLDDARQQLIDKVASTWEDLKRKIEERIQAEIQREIQRRINALCGTAPTGVIIAAGVVWWRRRRR
jgi:hypothetical protein